jgi:hypothetical protein
MLTHFHQRPVNAPVGTIAPLPDALLDQLIELSPRANSGQLDAAETWSLVVSVQSMATELKARRAAMAAIEAANSAVGQVYAANIVTLPVRP